MKTALRLFLINATALYLTAAFIPGLVLDGGIRTIVYASVIFMLINLLIVPILKIMFLPLNLLTLGIFSWAINVLALYLLTTLVPQLRIVSFNFTGANLAGVMFPAMELNMLAVAIIASFMIGFISHFLSWLMK